MTRIVASLLLPFALCAPLLSWTATPAQGAAGARAKLVVGETHVAELPAEGSGAAVSAEWHLAAEASETVTVALESYDFDAFVAVRAPDAATVVEADQGGLGTDARVTLDLAAGVDYLVRVERRAGSGGEYTLRVERGLPALPQGVERQAAELAYWNEAAQRAHGRGDVRRELLGLRAAAQYALELRRWHPAVERLRSGLALAEESRESGEAMFARAMLGYALQRLGRTDEALALLERSRTELAATRLDTLRAQVLASLAEVHFARGELVPAEELLRERLAIVRELGYAQGELVAHARLADVLAARGALDEALALLESERERALELGPEQEALALVHEAAFLLQHGELEAARDAVRGALERTAESSGVRLDALGVSADVEEAFGHLAAARELYTGVLSRADTLRDERVACLALARLASLANRLWQHDRARALIAEALAREPDEELRVQLWNERGTQHGALDEHTECVAAHERALEIARTAGRVDDEVRTLIALANARERQGDLGAASALAEQARARASAAGSGRLASLAEINLGYFELLAGAPAEGLRRCERALEEAGGTAAPEVKIAALETIARASIALADVPRARAAVDRVQILLELPARAGLGIDDTSGLRASHAWWAQTLEQDLTALVVSTTTPGSIARERAIERGFEACGAWKQRALREILAQRRGSTRRATTVPTAAVRAALTGPGTALIEYAVGTERLLAYVLTADVLTLVDLGPREPLEELTRSYLVGISDPASLATASEVARHGHALYRGILAPALDALPASIETLVVVPTADLAALPFEALVADLPLPAADVRDLTQVEFVLDRMLVTYAPSTPVLVELARAERSTGAQRALLLGDPLYEAVGHAELVALRDRPIADELPRLIGTRLEVLELARLLLAPAEDQRATELLAAADQRSVELETEPFTLCLGAAASAERLLEGLEGYGVLHVGAHGFVDPEEPRNTGIALAGDQGFVSIGDVAGLELDLELAVLSACQTALGPIRSGEGVQSLANAFLRAGTRSVVASLWQVRDLETSSLMRDFYRARQRDGLPTARALRAAKLEQRATRGLRGRFVEDDTPPFMTAGHPYFWAACVYVGLTE